jgi:ribosome-associated toxin RatA of RatAB toxin-antitoxin module
MSALRESPELGPMPVGLPMHTVDEAFVRAPVPLMFEIVRDVERWPALLPHYRWVRFHEHSLDGGGVVEMAANRPFGQFNWATWWLSEMQVISGAAPAIRFRHIGGITTGMEVEWALEARDGGTFVRLVHSWNGPRLPLIGALAATTVIGPVFVHGIAARTIAGLGRIAARDARQNAGK